MGLNSSKAHSKVTKVAPMPRKEELSQPPGSWARYGFQSPPQERNSSSLTETRPVLEWHLPPLREAGHGRYPTVPTPVTLDLTPEAGETSIIKQHPPRRLQKLQPLILAKDIPSEKFLSLQDGVAAYKAKDLQKRGQAIIHPTRRRQHLHKMKMLEMRQEAELKRRLWEARLNQTRIRDLNMHPMLGQRNYSSDDDDVLAIEHDPALNGDHGDPWGDEFFEVHGLSVSHPGGRGKEETWVLKQQARGESFWDASSTDSEIRNGDDDFGKPCQRHALVRTKTERIPLFDKFFDEEL